MKSEEEKEQEDYDQAIKTLSSWLIQSKKILRQDRYNHYGLAPIVAAIILFLVCSVILLLR